MVNTMLFKALREFNSGLLNQLLVNFSGKEGEVWIKEFTKYLRGEPCWLSKKQLMRAFFYKDLNIVLKPTNKIFDINCLLKFFKTKEEGGLIDINYNSFRIFEKVSIKGRKDPIYCNSYIFMEDMNNEEIKLRTEKLYCFHNIFDATELASRWLKNDLKNNRDRSNWLRFLLIPLLIPLQRENQNNNIKKSCFDLKNISYFFVGYCGGKLKVEISKGFYWKKGDNIIF